MRLLLTALLGLTVSLLAVPAPSATATSGLVLLALTSEPARADEPAAVRLVATDAAGVAVPGLVVGVERLVDGAWTLVQPVTTDAAGAASLPVTASREPAANLLRATYPGDAARPPAASAEHALSLVPREGRVRLRGPRTVVDERSATLRVEWAAATGQPVAGTATLQRRLVAVPGESMTPRQRRRQPWRSVQQVETGADGTAVVEVAPRATFRWRVVAPELPWVTGARSRVRTLRNLPPGIPVRLPAGAPRPRRTLPPQQRAVGTGANPVVTPLPDPVWNHMRGRSWRPGCPVGRSDLRLVRVNYHDFDGYRRRGELVVHAAAAGNVAAAFAELHARRFPVRSMYRVDRFGWSARLRGADDYASMAAGNTSAFNCRQVVGNPAVRSPHSWGRSVDLNPWENPYRSRHGLVPSPWWAGREHPRYAWRSHQHPVVALMRRHGLRWTYGRSDNHHFDAVGGVRGRPAAGLPERLADLLTGDACGGVCK
ncbi:M15 family metallopeptidase [Nocardioides solisilvae]|uniref:M15 family metallopeptidase n=1 Tax=Nocardioides solisilvae TaxID=1542435 RepID=UPI000D74BF1A|nr:M15 family metallopeptidase [Nocardioides solisilvae]